MDSNAERAVHGDLIEISTAARVDFGKRMQVAQSDERGIVVLDNRVRVKVPHGDYMIVRRCGRPGTADQTPAAVALSKAPVAPKTVQLTEDEAVAKLDAALIDVPVTRKADFDVDQVKRMHHISPGRQCGKTAAIEAEQTARNEQARELLKRSDGVNIDAPHTPAKASAAQRAKSAKADKAEPRKLETAPQAVESFPDHPKIGSFLTITSGKHLDNPQSRYIRGETLKVTWFAVSTHEVHAQRRDGSHTFIVEPGCWKPVDAPAFTISNAQVVDVLTKANDEMQKQTGIEQPHEEDFKDFHAARLSAEAHGAASLNDEYTLKLDERGYVAGMSGSSAAFLHKAVDLQYGFDVAHGADQTVVSLYARKHSHYFKTVPCNQIDVYRVLAAFNVVDPCIQHALKKLLVAGGRGSKDISRDVGEAIDTLVRWQEMRSEEAKAGA